jgi:hypothetical protein
MQCIERKKRQFYAEPAEVGWAKSDLFWPKCERLSIYKNP